MSERKRSILNQAATGCSKLAALLVLLLGLIVTSSPSEAGNTGRVWGLDSGNGKLFYLDLNTPGNVNAQKNVLDHLTYAGKQLTGLKSLALLDGVFYTIDTKKNALYSFTVDQDNPVAAEIAVSKVMDLSTGSGNNKVTLTDCGGLGVTGDVLLTYSSSLKRIYYLDPSSATFSAGANVQANGSLDGVEPQGDVMYAVENSPGKVALVAVDLSSGEVDRLIPDMGAFDASVNSFENLTAGPDGMLYAFVHQGRDVTQIDPFMGSVVQVLNNTGAGKPEGIVFGDGQGFVSPNSSTGPQDGSDDPELQGGNPHQSPVAGPLSGKNTAAGPPGLPTIKTTLFQQKEVVNTGDGGAGGIELGDGEIILEDPPVDPNAS